MTEEATKACRHDRQRWVHDGVGPGEVVCKDCGAREPVRVMAPCYIDDTFVRIEVTALGLEFVGEPGYWQPAEAGKVISAKEWRAWCEANSERIIEALPARARLRFLGLKTSVAKQRELGGQLGLLADLQTDSA